MSAFENESELESRLENLRGELECYGKDIKCLVESIYGHDVNEGDSKLNNIDLKNSPFQLISLLRQEVTEIIEESQNQDEVVSRAQADIKFCDEMSEILANISSIVDLMNQFEDDLTNFRFRSALNHIHEIESYLESLPSEDKLLGKGKVCRSLKVEHRTQKIRLSSKILRLLNESINIDSGIIKVAKSLTGYIRCEDKIISDSIQLDDLWSLAISCGALDEFLDKFLESLWDNVFVAIWREKKTQIPSITSNTGFAEIVFVLGSKSSVLSRDLDLHRAGMIF